MAIDIDKLTEGELIDLNNRIVARPRFLQQMRAHASMASSEPAQVGDLGFTVHVRKSGEVEIRHHGRVAALLHGKGAQDFLARVADPAAPRSQQLMARLTGNYKRGNERSAAAHPRNRRRDGP